MALWLNGALLGLTCNRSNFVKSSPQPASVPQILHPTQSQLTIPHHDWIDRFPFPKWRDNLILLSYVIDSGELFKDFFTMRSFTLKEGALAWDPQAWEMSPDFQEKWGYLFY